MALKWGGATYGDSMKIVIDREACTGHARCVALAPGLFTDDDMGYGQVIGDGSVTDETLAQATRAVQGCPERAISLVAQGPGAS